MTADPVDAALIEALSTVTGPGDAAQALTLEELAARAGLPEAVVEATAREGLLHPVPGTDPVRFTADDLSVLTAGTTLLEAGLPLGELLDLARRTDQTLRELADHSVDVFLRFVRDPVRGTAEDADEAADRLVTAFRSMLPATGELVGAHFRRLLVAAARARVEAEQADAAS